MGFTDEEKIKEALIVANGDTEAAIDFLVNVTLFGLDVE